MTVGDLIDALQRYDRDRVVAIESRVLERVVSIEPAGAVLLRTLPGKTIDVYSTEITDAKAYRGSMLWGFGSGDDA